MSNLPTHLAIVPDGNRRWAKLRGLPSAAGHQAGAEMAEKVFDEAYKQGIKYLSFWAGSVSNLTNRSTLEIAFLNRLYERFFKKLLKSKELHERKARVRVLGSWKTVCPKSLQEVISELENASKDYSDCHLTILLAYNGTDEMVAAVNSIMASAANAPITAETLKNHLATKDLPPVDLVIRTGVEDDPHNSAGFMMWDTAEAQLYFSPVKWPDFSPVELNKVLANYAERERRLGK